MTSVMASRLRASRPMQITTQGLLLRRPLSYRPTSSLLAKSQTEHNPNEQRDAQHDRHKIDTGANEYAKSGTDDTAAQNESAAFNPNITDPQEAKKEAGKGNEVNPLDASPANPDLGKPTNEEGPGIKKKESEA